MVQALLIDLDDTLYDERSYVLSGFRVVAEEIAKRLPGVGAQQAFQTMTAHLEAHGRGKVFDRALELAGAPADPAMVGELVQVYRDHAPAIALWPGVEGALAALAKDYRLAIVTDGLGAMQRRKIAALDIDAKVDAVLYCWERGAPKPDPASYHEALRRLDATPERAVVIGDRPDHDMAAAAAVGCRSIRVLTGRYATADAGVFNADATAADFTATPQVLCRENFGEAP